MAETTKHRQAFDLYWRLGSQRSIEKLHSSLAERQGRSPSLRTLYEWSSRYHWLSRISRLEREAREAEDAARVAEIRDMQDRQAKAGLLLQQKGLEWLVALDVEDATPEAAVRAISEGAKLERLARGEATERQEMNGEITTRLAGIDDGELDALIELAQSFVGGEAETPPG